jgi:hypothetical protein
MLAGRFGFELGARTVRTRFALELGAQHGRKTDHPFRAEPRSYDVVLGSDISVGLSFALGVAFP